MTVKKLDDAYDDFSRLCDEYGMEAIKIDKNDSYFEVTVVVCRAPEETDTKSMAVETIYNNIRLSYSLRGYTHFDAKEKTWEFHFNL